MSPQTNETLQGNFLWTREFMPESDDDLIEAYQRMIYEVETDMETMFRRQGMQTAKQQSAYFQLPLWWNELPRRLMAGIPLVESYDFVGRLYRMAARKPGGRPAGGRGRIDKGPSAR